ncbi:MAG TPA: TlpA disulfide reductase family protein [Verrucomicrobiae bacterium]
MSTKKLLFLMAVIVIAGEMARADDSNSVTQAWQALTNFSLPSAPADWATNPPTQAQLGKLDDAEEMASSAEADKARQFYLKFPNDDRSAEARLVEVEALQSAVHFGATNRLDALDMREDSLINDTNVSESVHYELRLDQVGRQLKAADESGADINAAAEAAGRELVKEFPAGPAGYQLLVDQAATGDLLTMHDLAEVMANSGGPKELTDFGTSLLNQINVIGKPLPVQFQAADGREIDVTTLSNKVVLVDFWASWCPPCVASIPGLVKLYGQYHTNGLEIVGINFDDDTNAALKCIAQNGVTWPQYFGGYGADNSYGRTYGQVLPFVWLADKKGIVQDIHGRADTEAKIKKLLAQ